jgi:hypothetical protein
MGQNSRYQPAPEPSDLEGWRKAIDERSLPTFRLEAIVAAMQDLGPLCESRVRNPLAKHLSDSIIGLLRKLVRPSLPDNGDEIIFRVHSELFKALLDPQSADGKGLREAFTPRVSFRIKDAIVSEQRDSRIPVAVKIKKTLKDRKFDETVGIVPATEPSAANDSEFDSGRSPARNANRDLSLLDGVRDAEQSLDVAKLMSLITDERKRLAFYLYMDDVPFGSKKGNSIARSLGVSNKTATEWVEEVRMLLASNEEIQEIQRASLGDNT